MTAAGSVYNTAIHLAPVNLVPGADGTYRGTGIVQWSTTYTPSGGACGPTTYRGSFAAEVTLRIDPADPNRAFLTAKFTLETDGTANIRCSGLTIPFPALYFTPDLKTEHGVSIGGSTVIASSVPYDSKSTVTVTKAVP